MLWRWREQCNSGGAACGPVLFHRGLLQQGSRDHRLESDQNRRVHSGLVSHAGQHAGHTLKGSLESHRHRQACGRLDTHAPPPSSGLHWRCHSSLMPHRWWRPQQGPCRQAPTHPLTCICVLLCPCVLHTQHDAWRRREVQGWAS